MTKLTCDVLSAAIDFYHQIVIASCEHVFDPIAVRGRDYAHHVTALWTRIPLRSLRLDIRRTNANRRYFRNSNGSRRGNRACRSSHYHQSGDERVTPPDNKRGG